MTMPCRTTQHCAVHGFCHRCAPPDLLRISRRINHVIQDAVDSSHWSELYAVAMVVLVEEIPKIRKDLAEQQRAKASQYAILRSEEMRLRAEGLREGADMIHPEEP